MHQKGFFPPLGIAGDALRLENAEIGEEEAAGLRRAGTSSVHAFQNLRVGEGVIALLGALVDAVHHAVGGFGMLHEGVRQSCPPLDRCFSSIILSPPNGNVKMSPHERKDIRVESEGTATSERNFQLR